MGYIFSILLSLFILIDGLKGQDPQFTQFYSVPLYLGPSFAGATQQHRLSTTYRRQWVALPGDFATFTAAYDQYVLKYNSGIGFMYIQDQAGSGKLGFKSLNILYSYDITVKNTWHVRPGLSFIYSIYDIDFSKLKFGDQIRGGSDFPSSVEVNPAKEMRGNIDGAASCMIYNERFWMGLTVDHLLRPNHSFYSEKSYMPLKYSLYGGFKVMNRSRLLKPADESLSVAYLFRRQADYNQLDAGVYWYSSPYVLGFWYRGIPPFNSDRGDAVAFLAGFKLPYISIGYSYDFTVSNLITSTAGAHEITLIYEFTTQRKKRIHAMPCPEF
jgi:type IX secretion system PorP/SprF family membrane protein